jgi:hypothetical protein
MSKQGTREPESLPSLNHGGQSKVQSQRKVVLGHSHTPFVCVGKKRDWRKSGAQNPMAVGNMTDGAKSQQV